jgi:hypothetical protein
VRATTIDSNHRQNGKCVDEVRICATEKTL